MEYRNQQRGVTLLELVVVIAIVAIFATMAVPSLTTFVRDNQLTSAKMQLVSDLNSARGEAIKRNTRVLVCSGDAITPGNCTNGADWAVTGWVLCYDASPQDGQCDVPTATDPNPFTVRAPLRASVGVNGLQVLFAAPAAPPMYFNPIGSQGAAGAASSVSFTLSGSWPGYTGTRTVLVASTGNITSQ